MQLPGSYWTFQWFQASSTPRDDLKLVCIFTIEIPNTWCLPQYIHTLVFWLLNLDADEDHSIAQQYVLGHLIMNHCVQFNSHPPIQDRSWPSKEIPVLASLHKITLIVSMTLLTRLICFGSDIGSLTWAFYVSQQCHSAFLIWNVHIIGMYHLANMLK
jgi:hypothetical protein